MTAMGTYYGQRAIREAVFVRYNSGTAYDRNLIDNIYHPETGSRLIYELA